MALVVRAEDFIFFENGELELVAPGYEITKGIKAVFVVLSSVQELPSGAVVQLDLNGEGKAY